MTTTVLEGELLQALYEAEKCTRRALDVINSASESGLTEAERTRLVEIIGECQKELLTGISQAQ